MEISRDASETERKPRILARKAGADWRPIKNEDGSFEIQQRILSDILLSPNLLILSGLGTSLCLRDATGTRVAPTMGDLWTVIGDN